MLQEAYPSNAFTLLSCINLSMGICRAKATSARAHIGAIFLTVSPGGKAIGGPMTTPWTLKWATRSIQITETDQSKYTMFPLRFLMIDLYAWLWMVSSLRPSLLRRKAKRQSTANLPKSLARDNITPLRKI